MLWYFCHSDQRSVLDMWTRRMNSKKQLPLPLDSFYHAPSRPHPDPIRDPFLLTLIYTSLARSVPYPWLQICYRAAFWGRVLLASRGAHGPRPHRCCPLGANLHSPRCNSRLGIAHCAAEFASVPALFMQAYEMITSSIRPSQPIALQEIHYSIHLDSSPPLPLMDGWKLIHANYAFKAMEQITDDHLWP